MTITARKSRPGVETGATKRAFDGATQTVHQRTDNFTVTGLIQVDLRNLGADVDWSAASQDAKRLLAEAADAPGGATVHVLVDGPADWGAIRYFRSRNPRLHVVVVGKTEHVRSWIDEFRGGGW